MITGKVAICYTDETEFTDIQGIGNDPIYKRFPSVYAIVEQHIDGTVPFVSCRAGVSFERTACLLVYQEME